jgi:hypothetical protein
MNVQYRVSSSESEDHKDDSDESWVEEAKIGKQSSTDLISSSDEEPAPVTSIVEGWLRQATINEIVEARASSGQQGPTKWPGLCLVCDCLKRDPTTNKFSANELKRLGAAVNAVAQFKGYPKVICRCI